MTRIEILGQIEIAPILTLGEHGGVESAKNIGALPSHMHAGIARFILMGVKPGSFLTAVFANEFEIAKIKADSLNAAMFDAYRDFLTWDAPADCWGSSDKVRAWCERGGLIGKEGAA